MVIYLKRLFYILMVLLILGSFSMPVLASETDLNILPDTIHQKDSTYTSVTDKYDVEVFTDKSVIIKEEYNDYKSQQNNNLKSSLFETSSENLSSEIDIKNINFAEKYDLFSEQKEEIYFKANDSIAKSIPIWLIAIAVLVLLTITVFISKKWHNRKK